MQLFRRILVIRTIFYSDQLYSASTDSRNPVWSIALQHARLELQKLITASPREGTWPKSTNRLGRPYFTFKGFFWPAVPAQWNLKEGFFHKLPSQKELWRCGLTFFLHQECQVKREAEFIWKMSGMGWNPHVVSDPDGRFWLSPLPWADSSQFQLYKYFVWHASL